MDCAYFHPDHHDPRFKAVLGLAPHTRLLLFVGRGAPEKNIGALLRAMRELGPDYHLLLAGPGMPHSRQPNVTVWPRFVRAALPRLLASADVFVHAGDQETFGLVVLEAKASGVPVVGVQGGAVAELVAPGCGALVPARDPPALARAVAAVCAEDRAAAGRDVGCCWAPACCPGSPRPCCGAAAMLMPLPYGCPGRCWASCSP